MAGSWLRGVVGVSLTLCVAGQALAAEGKVTVFAAASLTNAMQDIAQAYKKEKNVEVVSSFASSSTLALQKLDAWETLSPKLAPAEDVRGALALVERNEAPLGIVYGSDAVASKGVKVVGTFPEASHQKVEYPLAIVDGHRNAAVSAFYDYLKGPEASAIFKRYGFTTR